MILDEVRDFRRFVRQPLIEEEQAQQEQQNQQEQQQLHQQQLEQERQSQRFMANEPTITDPYADGDFKQHVLFSQPPSVSAELHDQFIGIHSDNLPGHDTDFPPRPQENLLMSPMGLEGAGDTNSLEPAGSLDDFLDLEKELEFGLDRKFP